PRGWLYTQHAQSGHNEPSVEPTAAIRDALKRSRFTRREAESSLRQRDSQGEGAARDVLAVGAVACVDEARLLGDLIADLPALTAAGQRKLHHSISVSTLSVEGQRGSIGISERSHETTRLMDVKLKVSGSPQAPKEA